LLIIGPPGSGTNVVPDAVLPNNPYDIGIRSRCAARRPNPSARGRG
jgi:hypothetical protein